MSAESDWCVIVNLLTCKRRGWNRWRTLLESNHISHTFHLTSSIAEVSKVISGLLKGGNRYFLFVGGDGTLHYGGNLLMDQAGELSRETTIGVLPCGTGNDWVRTYGVPANNIINSLKERRSVPLNVLKLNWPDGRHRYAMNMVGGALDAAVVDSLNKARIRIPGAVKYPLTLLKTLMKPHTWKGTILIDGKKLEGEWLTIQAGFGKYCGGGMNVLPHAREDEPALLLMQTKSVLSIIFSTPKIYSGKIIDDKRAMTFHFHTLKIQHIDKPIPIEADGEWLGTSPVIITPLYGVLNRLSNAE